MDKTWRDVVRDKLEFEKSVAMSLDEWHRGFSSEFLNGIDAHYPTVLVELIQEYLRPQPIWFVIGTSMGCKTVPNEDTKSIVRDYRVGKPTNASCREEAMDADHLHIYLDDLNHHVDNHAITEQDWENDGVNTNASVQLYVDGATSTQIDYACYIHDIDLFSLWWSSSAWIQHAHGRGGYHRDHFYEFCRYRDGSNKIFLTKLEFCL